MMDHVSDACAVQLDPPPAPRWAQRLWGERAEERRFDGGRALLRVREGGEFLWLEWTIRGASELADADFSAAVARAYAALGELLRQRARHPLRIWNYLAQIRRSGSAGFTRYELFNAGRRAGYASWFGERLERGLPASSAVGCPGEDWVVHVLAAGEAGVPVENPRQRPAYRYSPRYGPVAPCFARATLVPRPGAEPWAVLSGTASIVGEDSRHAGDLRAQLGETLDNLASVVSACAVRARLPAPREPLALCRELRAYVPQPQHAVAVQEALRRALPQLERLELVQAELCRPELLVELEGVLALGGRAAPGA
jgi:chorismate lyase/3-hydroxybenzoate synthase